MSPRPSDEPALFPQSQWIRRGASSKDNKTATSTAADSAHTRKEPSSAAATTTGASSLRRANSCWPSASSGPQPSSLHLTPSHQWGDSSGKPASSRYHHQSSATDYRVHRPASVPPQQAEAHLEGKFDAEFPSLRDASSHPGPAATEAPLTKEAPYRPAFLTDRVSTNWTSKLADAPVLPVEPPPSTESALTCSSSDNASASNSPTHATHPGAPAAASQPSGWSALASGEGHRPKLLDALTQQPGPAVPPDANVLRAQLAVRQSKQLVPLLARKGDTSKATAGDATAAKPANPLGRQTLLSTVAALRTQQQPTDPRTAAAATAAASSKLVLRPSRGSTGGGGADSADPPASAAASGMLSLRRSPPPASTTRQLHSPSLTTKLSTSYSAAQARASQAPVSPTLHQQHHQPESNALGKEASDSPASKQDVQPSSEPQPALGAESSRESSSHTWLSSSGGKPRSSAGSEAGGATPDASNDSLPVALNVPAEEVAFLKSLGWSDGEDEEDEEGAGLTEEEIAAFKAAAASRCTTPQLVLTPLGSRTTSPAPLTARGLPHLALGAGMCSIPRLFTEGSGMGVVDTVNWMMGQHADQQALPQQEAEHLAVEPLFPGVSKGWFGSLALPASPCMHSEPR